MGFVSALLETDPNERLTAEESLAYPWLRALTDSPRRSPPRRSPSAVGAKTAARSNDARSRTGTTPRQRKAKSPSPLERTRSNRSIRSVARSDHAHRVRPAELERLWADPHLRSAVFTAGRAKAASAVDAPPHPSRPRHPSATAAGTVIAIHTHTDTHTDTHTQRRALGPSSSDNYCIVGVASSLPRTQHANKANPAVKNYGLV